MANSERREINKEGKMFIPMNMTGSSDNEHFINVPKLLILGGLVFGTVTLYGKLNGSASIVGYIVFTIIYILVVQFILRKFIFEENYFFKMWMKVKSYVVPTPEIFWNISSISHTKDGDIVIFSDMKIGCFIKLERDTIVGKVSDYMERHIDAWSDFYKEINLRNLNIVQMNIMELAEKDSRIDDLSLSASKCQNIAVRNLLELEVGYVKEISRATLSESDYILIYDKSVTHLDTIISDINDCKAKLLEGAYAEVNILKEKEIYQLPKDMHNVKYFDGIAAQINVYKSANYKVKPVMVFESIGFDDKKVVKLGDKERNVIAKLASLVKDESLIFGEWSTKEALEGSINVFNLKNKSSSVNIDDSKVEKVRKPIKAARVSKVRKQKEKMEKSSKIINSNINEVAIKDEDDDEEDLLS